MSKVIKLGMVFESASAPDFGSIERSPEGEFTLLDDDKAKLNTALKKSVCAPLLQDGSLFSVQSGAIAVVVDEPAVWRYHAGTDTWYEIIEEL